MEQNSKIKRTKEFQIDYIDARIDSNRPLEHFHDSYELDFFKKADIQLFCRDRTYHISDGDMLFINEFDLHKIFYKPEKEYIRFVINFKRSFLEDSLNALELNNILVKLAELKNSRIRLSLKRAAEIQSAFQNIYRQSIIKDDPYTTAKIKLQLAQLLLSFCESMKDASEEYESCNQSVIVNKIISYVDTNYMKTITLDSLEQEFFLSKYYISHLFKKVTGFTVIEYIQSRRIIEVQKRLINTAMSSEIIGAECGFKNVQHFYKTFKEITEVTPKKYRDISKKSNNNVIV